MQGAGLTPLPDDRVVLVDARDLDPGEDTAVDASGITRASTDNVMNALPTDGPLYVHVDLDVVDRNIDGMARRADSLGVRLLKNESLYFSEGNVFVRILENVRGRDVFVVQPTCEPTNDNLMELAVMIDALRWASAGRITAVIPYFGYARQDRRVRSARVPISAKATLSSGKYPRPD